MFGAVALSNLVTRDRLSTISVVIVAVRMAC
jgi:hypothetical protein